MPSRQFQVLAAMVSQPRRIRVGQVDNSTKELQELRDRFATAALTALISNLTSGSAFAARPDKHSEDVAHERLATEAYRWADAMLKVREAEQPS